MRRTAEQWKVYDFGKKQFKDGYPCQPGKLRPDLLKAYVEGWNDEKNGTQNKPSVSLDTLEERERWKAAVDALYEEKKAEYQDGNSDVTLQYFEGATTVLEELLAKMEEADD